MEIQSQKYLDPWLHYVLPNFLSREMFDLIKTNAYKILDFDTPKKESMVNFKHDKDFKDWFVKLYPTFCDMLEVPCIKPVNAVFQYTCFNDCDHTNRYDGGIHSDSFDKQISCLIPISEFGSGTMLYDENKSFVKQIEWKQNSAFLFANKPTYWHSVGNANGSSRCLLNVIYYPAGYSKIHEKLYNVKRSTEHLKNKS